MCADSPELSLLDKAISTKISCAGSCIDLVARKNSFSPKWKNLIYKSFQKN